MNPIEQAIKEAVEKGGYNGGIYMGIPNVPAILLDPSFDVELHRPPRGR